jgi:hypothetical protein
MTQELQLENNDLLTYKSIDENSSPKPRLNKAIKYFRQKYFSGEFDINELEQYYLEWVNFDEFIFIIKKIVGKGKFKLKYDFVKCSKRGNDVYNYRVSKKFNLIYKALENYEADQDNCYILQTDILFFTLTYANRDLYEVYENSGEDYNRFMSNLRKIFPRAKTIARCFEAQRDGVIHIHALIYIGTHIDITSWINQKGKKVYIIKSYKLWNMLKNCWKYGFSDIQGFVKFRDGLSYIFKYIKKGTNIDLDNSSLTTLSLNWLFLKRSFSINYKILRILFNIRIYAPKHNSNLQDGGIRIKYTFIGIFSATYLKLNPEKWFYELNKLPDRIRKLIEVKSEMKERHIRYD